MHVTFLGTADGHTSARRNHSGLLLKVPEGTILFDCGAPVAQYLLQQKISPDVPDAIWLSHSHSDHIGQFSTLIQSLWLRARRAPLHVYAPGPLVATLRDYLEKCLLFPELIGFPVHWHGLTPRSRFKQGPFSLRAVATEHLDNLASFFQKGYPETCFECYGAVVEHRKARYVYSSDLALPRELRPALKSPVKALFCELTHFPEEALFKELAAAPARVASLWITHYPDHLRTGQAGLRKLAKACRFKGSVHVMQDRQSCVI